MRIIYSAQAIQELQNIRRHSQAEWGSSQAKKYHAEIRSRIRQLKDYPYLGQVRPELNSVTRQLVIGHHVALYRVESDRIVIQRVVHKRMHVLAEDFASETQDPEGAQHDKD